MTSSRPSSAPARATIASMLATSPQSASIAIARRLLPAGRSLLQSAAARSAAAKSISPAATTAPSAVIASAVARPMPAPAPVTSTALSCKTGIIASDLNAFGCHCEHSEAISRLPTLGELLGCYAPRNGNSLLYSPPDGRFPSGPALLRSPEETIPGRNTQNEARLSLCRPRRGGAARDRRCRRRAAENPRRMGSDPGTPGAADRGAGKARTRPLQASRQKLRSRDRPFPGHDADDPGAGDQRTGYRRLLDRRARPGGYQCEAR